MSKFPSQPPVPEPSSGFKSVPSSTPSGQACPCIDTITTTGLYVWTQESKNDGNKAASTPDHYLLMPSILGEDNVATDFVDFVFPILVGGPHITPLDKKWIDK